jgi:hypothetical protein
MPYQEEKQLRLRQQDSKRAITLAMQGRWREAVAANQSLIEMFPKDADAYNRLGRAHMEMGDYSRARKAYSRTLELEPYNTIAKKNLHRLSHLESISASPESDFHKVDPQHFIEETGKAGVVNLYQLAPPEILARMIAGDRVHLKIEGASLTVENSRKEYLGQVEPKHGQRIIKFMKGGNQYTATVLSSTEDRISVIIRETYQDPSQSGQHSFPLKEIEGLRPYISSDRMIKRELQQVESLPDELGYTIVGGKEGELLAVESSDNDEANDEE